MSVRDAVREYLIDCRARQLSEKTLRWYEQKLRHFVQYLDGLEIENVSSATSPRIVRKYLNFLRATDAPRRSDEKISGHTIAGYDQVLRSFFNFLHSDEIVDKNPMARIRKVRRPDTLIPTFTAIEVDRMLGVYSQKKTFIEQRNYCILVCLYDTGIRLSELLQLRVEDVSLDSWSFVVREGKRAKDRMVPIGRVLRNELAEYLPERDRVLRAEGLRDRGFLFFRIRDGAHLSSSFVYRKIVRAAGEKAGVEGKRVSPHTWRHTSAVDYIRSGGDVFSLKEKLGHKDLQTTEMYVRLAAADIRMMHRRHSPLDHLDIRK